VRGGKKKKKKNKRGREGSQGGVISLKLGERKRESYNRKTQRGGCPKLFSLGMGGERIGRREGKNQGKMVSKK